MTLLRQMLAAGGVAFAVSAILSALAEFFPRERGRHAAAAVAVAIGYAAGHIFITGWVPLPPVDTTNWLPCFALAAAGVGSLLPFVTSKTARAVLIALASIGAQRLLLEPKFRYGWTAVEGWQWVVCLGLTTMLVAICLGVIARRAVHPAEPAVILWIVCSAASCALAFSGSFLLGQFGAVLAATVLGSFVLALRRHAIAEAMGCVCALLLVGLLASGYFFADLPSLSFLLLAAAAPVCALIPNRIFTPRWAATARVALACAIGSLAVLVALRSSPPWSG